MIPWRIEFHANPDGTGALIDADVGGEPVLVISNHANSSIVVPSTLMPRVSQGIYEYDQTNDVPGQTYDVTYTVTVDGQTVTWNGKSRTSGVDAWYYSDRAGVATVLDTATIAVTWDLDDANGEDAGAMLADGITADGYIDLYLANEGVTVPVNLTTATAHIVKALADVSNHMTVWYGWTHRGLEELSTRTGRSSADLAGLMSGYKTYADEQLEKIASVLLGSHAGTPAATGMLSVIVGAPKQYPGTGCVRPFAVTLPNATNGNVSW
jgi:hypothetical protein